MGGIGGLGQDFRPVGGGDPAHAVILVVILSPEVQGAVKAGGDLHDLVGGDPAGSQGAETGAGGGSDGGGQILTQIAAALEGGDNGILPPCHDGVQLLVGVVDIRILRAEEEQTSQYQRRGDRSQCGQLGTLQGALPCHGSGEEDQGDGDRHAQQGQGVGRRVGDHQSGDQRRQGQQHHHHTAPAPDQGSGSDQCDGAAQGGEEKVQRGGLPVNTGEFQDAPVVGVVPEGAQPGDQCPDGAGDAAHMPQPDSGGAAAEHGGQTAVFKGKEHTASQCAQQPDDAQPSGGIHRQVQTGDHDMDGAPAQAEGDGQRCGGGEELMLHGSHLPHGTGGRRRWHGPAGCPRWRRGGRAGRRWL